MRGLRKVLSDQINSHDPASTLPLAGEGEAKVDGKRNHFLSAAAFLHSERNFLRSLP